MKMKIVSIIISIIGAICLGICLGGIIHHIINCELDGTVYTNEICIIDGGSVNDLLDNNFSDNVDYYEYSIEEQRNNVIVIIVTFIICIISTLFLKLKSKIIPLIYTIITSIIVYDANSLGRGAVDITGNPMTARYNALYDTYCTNIIIILVIITIVYIIKLIKDYKDYKKENS